MKQKLLRFSLLSVFALLCCSGAWAETATFIFNTDAGLIALGITKPAVGAGTNLSTENPYVISNVSMGVTNGSNTATRVWNSSGATDLRIYNGSKLTFQAPVGYNITSIVLAGTTVGGFSCGTNGSFSNGTWSGSANSVELTATGTEKINTITVLYEDASDTRSATTVTISNNQANRYVNEETTTPVATVKAGETTIDGATVAWSSTNTSVATINESTGAITLVGPGTTIIKANYAGTTNDYKPSEASYTLSVYGIFTTMAQLQAGCTAYGNTAMPAKVTFDNVYVTAVKGNNAYISDGTNGAVIYKSGHGFAAGDKLTCSALEMTILNFGNYTPEITSLSSQTEGLTV